MSLGTAGRYKFYVGDMPVDPEDINYSENVVFLRVNKKINQLNTFEMQLALQPDGATGNVKSADKTNFSVDKKVYALYGVDGLILKGVVQKSPIKNDLTVQLSGVNSCSAGKNNLLSSSIGIDGLHQNETAKNALEEQIGGGEGDLVIIAVDEPGGNTNTNKAEINFRAGMTGLACVQAATRQTGAEFYIGYGGTNFGTDTLEIAGRTGRNSGITLDTSGNPPTMVICEYETNPDAIINDVICVATGKGQTIETARVSAVVTQMMTLLYEVDTSTISGLTEYMESGDSTVSVDTASYAPVAPGLNFVVRLDDEFMEVDSVAGQQLTVLRGTAMAAGIRSNLDALAVAELKQPATATGFYYRRSRHKFGTPVIFYGQDGTCNDVRISVLNFQGGLNWLQIGSESLTVNSSSAPTYVCTRATSNMKPHRQGVYAWNGVYTLANPEAGSSVELYGAKSQRIECPEGYGYDAAELYARSLILTMSPNIIDVLRVEVTNPESHVSNLSPSWLGIGDTVTVNSAKLGISYATYRIIEWEFTYTQDGTSLKFTLSNDGLRGYHANVVPTAYSAMENSTVEAISKVSNVSSDDKNQMDYSSVEGKLPGRLNLSVYGMLFDPTDSVPAVIKGAIYFNFTAQRLKLCYDGINWKNVLLTGDGAIPGGLDTQIQFNDGGSAFGGDAEFTWNKTSNILHIGSVADYMEFTNDDINAAIELNINLGGVTAASGYMEITLGDNSATYFEIDRDNGNLLFRVDANDGTITGYSASYPAIGENLFEPDVNGNLVLQTKRGTSFEGGASEGLMGYASGALKFIRDGIGTIATVISDFGAQVIGTDDTGGEGSLLIHYDTGKEIQTVYNNVNSMWEINADYGLWITCVDDLWLSSGSGSGDEIAFFTGSNIEARLGDAAGVYAFFVSDSGANAVAYIDSDGKIQTLNDIECAGYYYCGGNQGQDGTITVISALRWNVGVLEKKSRSLTFYGGIITTIGTETGWVVV